MATSVVAARRHSTFPHRESPDGQHTVIKVLSTYPTEAHLNFLRETFAVNGELKEVHDEILDVKLRLTFTEDYGTLPAPRGCAAARAFVL